MRTGSARPGQVDLLEPLGEARHADVLEPELLEHAHRDAELALAAVDRAAGSAGTRTACPAARAFVALVEVAAEPAGEHLLHRREVVLALLVRAS